MLIAGPVLFFRKIILSCHSILTLPAAGITNGCTMYSQKIAPAFNILLNYSYFKKLKNLGKTKRRSAQKGTH